jgi:hypothetical protein
VIRGGPRRRRRPRSAAIRGTGLASARRPLTCANGPELGPQSSPNKPQPALQAPPPSPLSYHDTSCGWQGMGAGRQREADQVRPRRAESEEQRHGPSRSPAAARISCAPPKAITSSYARKHKRTSTHKHTQRAHAQIHMHARTHTHNTHTHTRTQTTRLDELVGQLDAGLGVDDGGVGVVDEVARHDVVLGVAGGKVAGRWVGGLTRVGATGFAWEGFGCRDRGVQGPVQMLRQQGQR